MPYLSGMSQERRKEGITQMRNIHDEPKEDD